MQRKPLLPSFDLEGVAQLISAGAVGRIVVMCGAGISVSAGIPDFRALPAGLPGLGPQPVGLILGAGMVLCVCRTPGTGLYSQLARYNLPRPEAVFSLSFFSRSNPRPFTQLAAELLPGRFTPTPTHYFLALLHRKGLLLRCFTQNIDSLESVAGLPAEAVVAAHGNFDSASCIDCGRSHPIDWVKAQLLAGNISRCSLCGSLVKPDIVFFGEALPQRFHQLRRQDLQRGNGGTAKKAGGSGVRLPVAADGEGS
ncbi:hypothetical protein QJQ45_021460 [Haematococcus lacustris]|nr:hypothetical protein QJQ45_021460 [Haematococcus lacustris]